MFYKLLGVPDVMRKMSYQWPADVSQVLCHPIYESIPVGYYYGPEGVALFVYFRQLIEFVGPAPGG